MEVNDNEKLEQASDFKKKYRFKVIAIGIVVLLIVCIPALFTAISQDLSHRSTYATGTTYEFTGYLDRAEDHVTENYDPPAPFTYSKPNPDVRSNKVHDYKIKITADSGGLPNDQRFYESTSENDYKIVSRCRVGHKYVFTVSADGKLVKVEPVE